tara:strand:+ start:126 stop:446 length:321 start_codon:yes stop_codon:yes gene_type:complete
MCPRLDFKDHCSGFKTFTNGSVYSGYFRNNKPDGQGTKIYEDGRAEQGIWKDGKFMYKKKPYKWKRQPTKIDGYKTFCSEIGFTLRTVKFKECVLEAMKKDRKATD